MSLDRYSRRKRNRSGIVYLIISIVFVIVMMKWGLPLIINVLAGPTGAKVTINSNEDTVPPQTPMMAALPEATKSAEVVVSGYTEPKVEVTAWRNEELVATTTSDDEGAFEMTINLIEGENRIQTKAKDEAGNESQSPIKKVVFDNKGVDVTIASPADGAEVFGRNNQNLTVTGKVSKPEVTVTVNGNLAKIDEAGNYSQIIHLNEGDNNLVVKAVDRAGNESEKTIKVKLTF